MLMVCFPDLSRVLHSKIVIDEFYSPRQPLTRHRSNLIFLSSQFSLTFFFFSIALTIWFDPGSTTRLACTMCWARLSFIRWNVLYSLFSCFFFSRPSSTSLGWSSSYFWEIDWKAWETSNVCCLSKPLGANSISAQTSSLYIIWALHLTTLMCDPSHTRQCVTFYTRTSQFIANMSFNTVCPYLDILTSLSRPLWRRRWKGQFVRKLLVFVSWKAMLSRDGREVRNQSCFVWKYVIWGVTFRNAFNFYHKWVVDAIGWLTMQTISFTEVEKNFHGLWYYFVRGKE